MSDAKTVKIKALRAIGWRGVVVKRGEVKTVPAEMAKSFAEGTHYTRVAGGSEDVAEPKKARKVAKKPAKKEETEPKAK